MRQIPARRVSCHHVKLVIRCIVVQTLENPWSIVDKYSTEGLRVVCLETFDHELHGSIVHIGQRKICHIKYNGLVAVSKSHLMSGK